MEVLPLSYYNLLFALPKHLRASIMDQDPMDVLGAVQIEQQDGPCSK